MEIFIESGAAVSTPTCGPCLGGHMGILAKVKKLFQQQTVILLVEWDHTESEIYLANPAVAAASAVKGRIAHPEEVL